MAVVFAMAGWRLSRLRWQWWLLVWFVPAIVLAMIILARRVPKLELVAPFSWLMAGRREFAILGPIAALLLTTPAPRLNPARKRILVLTFMGLYVLWQSALPFLWPALIRNRLAALTTRIDSSGVCLQSTSYTCGPAAAVTALRRVGINAGEGELAILLNTTPFTGTAPDELATALAQRYAADGLVCEYRAFDSIDQLPRDAPTLAVIKYSFMMDHFLAILKVDEKHVTVGDPAAGSVMLSRAEFEEKWRGTGIVLRRPPRR